MKVRKTLLYLLFISCIFTFLFNGSTLRAQERPDSLWTLTLGGENADHGYAVLATSDGGCLLAGRTTSGEHGASDMSLAKVNYYGVVEWERSYGTARDETCYGLEATPDGGYILAGFTTDSENLTEDFYLVKIDSIGDVEWTQQYPNESREKCREVHVDSDGGYILVGDSFLDLDFETDIRIIKTDDEGEAVWNQLYGGADNENVGGILPLEDGGYMFAGSYYISGDYDYNVFLWRLDEDGDVIFQRSIGDRMQDKCFDIQPTSDGNFILVGYTYSFGSEYRDYYIVKVNTNGGQIWARHIGGASYDESYAVRQTTDGGYLIVGGTRSYGEGFYDMYLVKTDEYGYLEWDQTYGGEELDIAVAIDETPDAGYVITGYTHSFGAGESDAYLVRLESEDRPPAPFSLVSPENDSTVLYAPPYDFENTWNPAIDHNPLDTVFYDVFFQVDWDEVGDTTLVFHHITGNSINFNIVDSLGLNIWALDLPPRRVDWWVVAISGDDTVECDETWYFGLESFDPGAPVAFNLINPFNNDTLGTNQTPLIWQSSSDPDSEDPLQYIIWWATDESFTENLDSMFTPDTLFMRQNLIDDTGYWWKVRAQDIGSIGRWSGQTNHLQVYIPEPPASFKLLTPNSGDTIVSDVGLMEWEEAIDPDPDDFVQYKVYWAEDEAFIAGLDSNTTNATSFWLTGLHHKQFYWWKVEALDFNTEGIWSDDVFHFMAYYPELNGALYLTDSNEAIAGARLVLTNVNEDSFTSLTDNDGRYIFYNVPTGEYSIEISHPDYVTMHESSILLMDGVTLDLDFSLERAYRSHTPLQPNYFELISFYIFPEDYFAETVFRSVGSLVVAVSDDDGVWRRPALNTIGEINAAEGYRLLSIADDTLHIEGNPIDVDIVYHLKEEKSNFLGYPFDFPASIESALSPIQDSIIFVQTDDGRIWSPSDTINTIETMIPGEGYMIQVSGDIEFTYNIESTQIVGNNSIRRELMSSDEEPRPTGLPYCVLVQLTDRIREKSPELIEIYDGFTLVGKERISLDHSITPVITWQGAPEFGVDGFAKGKPARIVIKNNAGTAISSRIIEDSIQFGKNAFARATVDYQVPLPDKFEVSAVYPNPFNASANLNFALPLEGEVEVGVFNIEGREIYHFVQHYSAGYHRFTFDSEASGLRLGSGMYFIRINQFENSVIRKVVLVK